MAIEDSALIWPHENEGLDRDRIESARDQVCREDH
jgi:hypothetical protein